MARFKIYGALIVLAGFTLAMNAHYLGFPTAMFRKGNMYFFGNAGHPQDFVKAVEWFAKAAEAGNEKAQNNLGLIYLDGRPGVPADLKLATKYFGMAAQQGYPLGKHNLGRCLMRADNPEQNWQKGFSSLLDAAEQGFGPSMGEIGRCYELGLGVASDSAKALHWYEEGSRVGDQFSCQRFGQMLFDGAGVTQDRPRGLALLILGDDALKTKAAREQATKAEREQATALYRKMLESLQSGETL